MRCKNIITILLITVFNYSYFITGTAQLLKDRELISPIYGKLMLVGPGEMTNRVASTFAFLAGNKPGKLIILNKTGDKKVNIHPQWKKHIGSIKVLALDKSGHEMSEAKFKELRNATAIWLMDDFSGNHARSLIIDELNALLHRGGVIGGKGVAAESLATLMKKDNEIKEGLNFLPNSFIFATDFKENQLTETLNRHPGRVFWEIPQNAAVVIHNGRQVAVVGDSEVRLRTAANGDWPERVETYWPPVDQLPYTTDLVSWNRSAVARLGEIYPPGIAPIPEVPSGALMIIGGHGFPDGMWEKVVEFAGGKDANYVCFSQGSSSTGAERLRELGCKNISVHMVKTGVNGIHQGNDKQLLEDLEKANAVYFGGGRTYKYMDAYLNTEAHILMRKVLDRGGIILGASAGAQIQGDFLVRGDPRTNDTLWMPGNDVGLGFIKGVIIDAHYRERGRENIFPHFSARYPQMLGIGIDETTAIFIQGSTAEVIGPHTITFYDFQKSENIDSLPDIVGNSVILMAGEKYDLKQRRKTNTKKKPEN